MSGAVEEREEEKEMEEAIKRGMRVRCLRKCVY